MKNVLEEFTAELNRHFFLREYSFCKNQFRFARGELELADHIIALPDGLFVFQLKERARDATDGTASTESWFRRKVLDKGCGQLADSIRFLRRKPGISVANQRGHVHELVCDERPIIPVLLYASGKASPGSIGRTRHRVSKRAGFVHVMHIRDYYNICHYLALPGELLAYFHFRRDLLLRDPQYRWDEDTLVAQFIDDSSHPSTAERVADILNAATRDAVSFDIGPILRRFGDKVRYAPTGGAGVDYYRILGQFSRLGRAEMRGFKRLLSWAYDHVDGDAPEIPARMFASGISTGFVIFPVPKSAFDLRLNALNNFATLAKYDFHAERQIGLCLAKDGGEVEIDWMFLEWPWQHDPELEKALTERYPFRPKPSPRSEPRYRLN
jgi:hypothetical protein